jgi:hypothetical protein
MKTRESSEQTMRTGVDLHSGNRGGRLLESGYPQPPPTESHWDELHGGSLQRSTTTLLRARLARRSWADLAVGLAAGALAGWWLASQRRSHRMTDRLMDSILPAASRGAHQAMEAVRSHGVRDFGRRLAKLKDRW